MSKRYGYVIKPTEGSMAKTVSAYLPQNYEVTREDEQYVYFEGEDKAGWTMEDYVIPRLASGLMFAKETTDETA